MKILIIIKIITIAFLYFTFIFHIIKKLLGIIEIIPNS